MQAITQSGYRPARTSCLPSMLPHQSFLKKASIILKAENVVQEMVEYYEDDQPSIRMSIEDGLSENDWTGWKLLTVC